MGMISTVLHLLLLLNVEGVCFLYPTLSRICFEATVGIYLGDGDLGLFAFFTALWEVASLCVSG